MAHVTAAQKAICISLYHFFGLTWYRTWRLSLRSVALFSFFYQTHCHSSSLSSFCLLLPFPGLLLCLKSMLAVCVVSVLSSVGCLLLVCFLDNFKFTLSSSWADFLLCIAAPCLHLFSLVLTVSMFSSSLLISHVSLYYHFICLYSTPSSHQKLVHPVG